MEAVRAHRAPTPRPEAPVLTMRPAGDGAKRGIRSQRRRQRPYVPATLSAPGLQRSTLAIAAQGRWTIAGMRSRKTKGGSTRETAPPGLSSAPGSPCLTFSSALKMLGPRMPTEPSVSVPEAAAPAKLAQAAARKLLKASHGPMPRHAPAIVPSPAQRSLPPPAGCHQAHQTHQEAEKYTHIGRQQQ
jgi:hypothetical protein